VTIIDRYLLRQFIKAFVVCYVSLTGLYIVFDAFTNLEGFLRCSDEAGGLLNLLVSFYSFKALLFLERTAGLLTLVAAMFTVSWIQRHNEMTALMAAGISRVRVIKPVVLAAVAVALFSAANRELLMPRFRDELARSSKDLLGDVGRNLEPMYDNETNVLIRGKATYRADQRIEQPNFLLPREMQDYGSQLSAANAYYHRPNRQRPGGYLLDEVEEPDGLAELPSLRLGEQVVVLTPRDAPDWLKPNQCFVVSNVSFDQLTGGKAFRQFASTVQLIEGLRNPSLDFGADIRVAIHTRIVQPLMDITLLFLGLPLVVSRENRNVFLAIALCMGVTTFYLLLIIGCQHLGAIYLIDPALAVWLPLMISIPAAVGLAESMWQ